MAQLGTKATAVGAVPARLRTWTLTASAALIWALFTLTVLHGVSSFDPLRDPVSRYAFTEQGSGMLEASLVSFAVGVVAVRGALIASGLRVSRTASVLVGASAAGLVAAALFPATFTAEIDPVSGVIHQYASLVAFLCLPAIAVCLLDQTRGVAGLAAAGRALARLLVAALTALTLFGLSYLADNFASHTPISAALAQALPMGVLQQIVFVLDFCLLAALLLLAHRAADRTSASAPRPERLRR